SPQPRPRTASRSAANSMRTSMPRASKSATPKWPPSTSKAMHSIQNGITPSRPVCPKIQDEVLNLPHRLSGALAIERLMQQELRHQDHRQQARAGKSARDRMRGRRRFGDRLAIAAGELFAHMLDDLPAPGFAFQRPGHNLAELVQRKRYEAPTWRFSLK